jgi:hypothetical protein
MIVIALSLGVLAAALVKLAGDTGPAPQPVTRTLTTAAAAPPATPTSSTPTTALPGAGVPVTPPSARTGAGTVPGVSTTPGAITTTPTAPKAKSILPRTKRKGGLGLGLSRALEERLLKARK